jgi:hypothetical protein
VAQAVEHLPSKHEAFSSNTSAAERERERIFLSLINITNTPSPRQKKKIFSNREILESFFLRNKAVVPNTC